MLETQKRVLYMGGPPQSMTLAVDVVSYIVQEDELLGILEKLIANSVFFQVTPHPFTDWEITVKAEARRVLVSSRQVNCHPTPMKCYISHSGRFGITGDLNTALRHENAPSDPADLDGRTMRPGNFEEVSEEEYDNTVLDLRFEDGEWAQ